MENVDKAFKEDADYGTATQRDCLQRPPSDGQVSFQLDFLNHPRHVFKLRLFGTDDDLTGCII